jgi:hypothetical protein
VWRPLLCFRQYHPRTRVATWSVKWNREGERSIAVPHALRALTFYPETPTTFGSISNTDYPGLRAAVPGTHHSNCKLLSGFVWAKATQNQNVSRMCKLKRSVVVLSEKIAFPEPAGWFACPNSGDVMFPMMGPGLLLLVRLRICIATTSL